VPLSTTFGEQPGVYTLPVIAYTQSKLTRIVSKLHLDLRCMRMVKGIPQRLGCDPKDLCSHNRRQFNKRAFNDEPDGWGVAAISL
jgi:hypothetical protein